MTDKKLNTIAKQKLKFLANKAINTNKKKCYI